MARKAIKGYPEKSYYDNTSFKGVHATLNPLNEGYFNQMINFDIDDTGQSIKPRRGFLTTTLQLKDKGNLSKDFTLYFFDPDISKYIFIDFSTFNYTSDDGIYSYSIDAYKVQFNLGPTKQFDDVEKIIGHSVGGVCPFGINENVEVYLDESLKQYEIIYPACGSSNSAVKLTVNDLETASNYLKWVDVCK